MRKDELDWGTTVKITAGHHKGKIGCYDNEEKGAVVYFGEIWYAGGYYIIPFKYLSVATTSDLLVRRAAITEVVCGSKRDIIPDDERATLLVELMYINDGLAERAMQARLFTGTGKKVFISHSSLERVRHFCGCFGPTSSRRHKR